ncbi:helix-turn-helix domain-containing protein [Microbacterium enclense]|uniref:helix-turn-helix domain-containing protein n=1 Tax=Microbacterium enclense TaxID=993073 RepID=UPI003D70CDC2
MNLRRRRGALGLTQEAVAERAGISLYAYQQYERGAVTKGGVATNPRLATVLTICEALRVPVQDLLPRARLLRPQQSGE